MKSVLVQAMRSVAVKEFIHIYRDWRILVLLLILPPVFTLIFGHAFENTGATGVPALLVNRDQSPPSAAIRQDLTRRTKLSIGSMASRDRRACGFAREDVQAALVIPQGWGESLKNGDPIPLPLYLDGSDTNTASELEGRFRKASGFSEEAARVNGRESPRRCLRRWRRNCRWMCARNSSR